MLDSRAVGGVPKLSFISEPEAAALATLQDVGTQPDIKVRSIPTALLKAFPYLLNSTSLGWRYLLGL